MFKLTVICSPDLSTEVLALLEAAPEARNVLQMDASVGGDQKIYSERGLSMATEMSEERLIDKFKRNIQGITGESKAREAIDVLLGLEEQEDISLLMKLLVP